MILPQPVNFTAILGATFNEQITLYQALNQSAWRGPWAASANYPLGAAVQGSNGNMYQALKGNTGVDPTTDSAGNWSPLLPFNLSPYSAVLQLGSGSPSLALTSGAGLTLGGIAGTVLISATPQQIAVFSVGRQHFYLQLTSGSTVIIPIKGQVIFTSP